MPTQGILEELFIADDLAGVKQVWFRNWSVTASLNLAGNWGAEVPESVAWGPTQDRFIVRTGATPNVQKYYHFRIPRALDVVFDEGVIPVATLVQTVTPYTSNIALTTIQATATQTVNWKQDIGSVTLTRTSVGGGCPVTAIGATAFTPVNGSEITTGTQTFTKILGDMLAGVDGAAVSVNYALNSDRQLVLFVIGGKFSALSVVGTRTTIDIVEDTSCGGFSVGCPCTATPQAASTQTSVAVSIVPRAENHLWVVNMATSVVVGSTAKSAPTLAADTRAVTGAGGGTGVTPGPIAVTGTAAPPNCPTASEICASALGAHVAGYDIDVVDVLGVVSESGVISAQDSLWKPYDFVTSNTYSASTSTTTSVSPNYRQATGFGLNMEWGAQWTVASYTGGTYWTYTVLSAIPMVINTPGKVLVVISRTDPTTTQYGLFLFALDGSLLKTLQGFTTATALAVLTADKSHVIWYLTIGGTSTIYLTAINLGINGSTKSLTTDLTRVLGEKFRLLDDTRDPTNGLLFDAREDVRTAPAGFFISAWDAGGSPDWTIRLGDGFPLRVELVPYEKVQVVPAGITFPVTP